MTVSTSARKQQFTLNGTTATLTFTFRALTAAPEDIKVKVTADDVDTDLTYPTDYTVSVNSNGVGGVVTLVDPAGVGSGTATVFRETTNTQNSDYDDYNQFPADTIETDLDIRTMVAQEQAEDTDRTLTIPISVTGVSAELPVPAADKVLGWNSAGTAIENKTFTPATSFQKADAADAVAQTDDVKYMTPTMTSIAIGESFPATNTADNVPQWDGANSKLLKDGLAVGVAANNLVQLDGSVKLPAIDGSQLTNLPGLGTAISKSVTTIYLAATDGFVIGTTASSGGGASITGNADGSSPPTTIIADYTWSVVGGVTGFICFPVKKGDYWRVVVSGVAINYVWWIPLGT